MLALAAAYYIGARIGFALTPQSQPVSTLWPPNAILFGTLLLAPPRAWILLLLAVLPVHLLVQLQSGVPWLMTLSWYVSNCSEALIGAAGIRWLVGGPLRLDSVSRVGVFVCVGAVGAPFLASFLDAALVRWNDFGSGSYWEVWQARFFSNVLAILSLVPAIVAWERRSIGIASLRAIPLRRLLEFSLLLAGLLVVCVTVFASPLSGMRATPVLITPMPFLLWSAVRFGPGGTSAALLIFAITSIWGAIHGYGPFVGQSVQANVLSLQLFLIVTHIPLLALAAVIRERTRAEDEARRNEARLNLALSAAQIGTWDWNLAGGRAWTGDAGEAARLEGEQRDFFDAVKPEDRAAVRQAMLSAIERGAPYEVEYRLALPDGSIRWVLGKGVVVHDGQGRPARMLGVNADITERKRAEAALRDETMLRESEARLRKLADTMPQVVFSAHADGRIDYFNGRWYELTGTESDTVPDTQWLAMQHPSDRDACLERWLANVEAGRPHESEGRVWSARTGTYRWHLVRALPVRDDSGQIVRWYGTATDIDDHKRVEQALRESEAKLRTLGEQLEHRVALRTTELSFANATLRAEINVRVRAEQALRASEEKFAKAFRAMPDAIAITGHPDSRVIEINERWEELFGHSRFEAVGRTINELGIFANRQERASVMQLMTTRGYVRDMEVDLCDKHGGQLQGVLAAELIEVGGAPCTIEMIRDITERRRAEQEVALQRRQLAHLGRVALVGELSGALAHELNQPLAAILANARAACRMLDGQGMDLTELRSILDDIVADDRRASDVMRRVRALIRRGEVELQPVVANELVGEVLALARSDLIHRAVSVTTHLSEALPPVAGDRVQLQQVLLNLIVNACDAMADVPPGERRLTITTEGESDGVHVAVTDHGTGIVSDALDSVFEPFVTSKEHGLGLGLAICRSIVDAHGGRMWASNNAHRGATFHVRLPTGEALSGDELPRSTTD